MDNVLHKLFSHKPLILRKKRPLRILREEAMVREAEERKRREEEARFMAEQQRLRDDAERAQEEKEAQEENERVQRQVSHWVHSATCGRLYILQAPCCAFTLVVLLSLL